MQRAWLRSPFQHLQRMTAGHDAAVAETVRVQAAARTGQADSAPFRAVGTSVAE